MSEYPDEEVLNLIKTHRGNPCELLELIQGLWHYPDCVEVDGDTWSFATVPGSGDGVDGQLLNNEKQS